LRVGSTRRRGSDHPGNDDHRQRYEQAVDERSIAGSLCGVAWSLRAVSRFAADPDAADR
jgi:hypothetical protein